MQPNRNSPSEPNSILSLSQYNYLYSLYEPYEPYLVRPASFASAGYLAFGQYGALAGLSLGLGLELVEPYLGNSVASIASNSFLITSTIQISVKPMLQKTLAPADDLEMVFSNMISYYSINIISFTAGIVGSSVQESGLLEEYPYVVDSIAMAGFGAYTYGYPGAIIGAASIPIDKVMQHYNFTSLNIASSSVQAASFLQIAGKTITAFKGHPISLLDNEAINNFIFLGGSLFLGTMLSANTEVTRLDIYKPIEIYNSISAETSAILGKEQTDLILRNKFYNDLGIGSISIHFLNNAIIRLNNLKSIGIDIARSQAPNNRESLLIFNSEIKSFTVDIGIFFLSKLLSSLTSGFYSDKLFVSMYDSIFDEYLSNNNALKIHNNPEYEQLIDSLPSHVYQITYGGIGISTQAVNDYHQAIYGTLYSSSMSAEDVLISGFFYNSLTNLVTKQIGEVKAKYSLEMQNFRNTYTKHLKHFHSHAKVVIEGRGEDFVKNQLHEAQFHLRKSQIEDSHLGFFKFTWERFVEWGTYVTSLASLIYFVDTKNMGLGDISALSNHAADATLVIGWSSSQAEAVSKIGSSVEVIKKIIHILQHYDEDSAVSDNIERSFGEFFLKLDLDVSISSTNTTLLSFDNISLNTGNIYAFTGPSGSGKSSANSKILGIKHNGIKGVGSITYPGDSLDDVSLVTQKDYIPQNSSLYEVLMYPRSKNEANSLNETYSQKILDLLTFLENDGTRDLVQELHQVKDWNSELSGGQVKKISIIRGLISDDKVIIFDEVFTGLDKKLLVRAQKLIKQYSQENQAVIIVVDHSAQDNNYNEFYTGELYVLNKKVDLRKLPSREIPEGYLEEKNEFLTCSIEHTWAEENFSVCMMGNISTIEEL